VHTNHVNILLPDYVRGILDNDDLAGVEEHLRNCPACQAELTQVREVLASIESAGVDSVPKAYFSSILPRVHQRLDRRKHFEWSKNPFLNKVILPLGAVIVVAVVLWRIPFASVGMINENPMMAVLDSATSEDFAEIVQDNIPSQELSSFNAMVISHALTNDRFFRRELVQEALASETTSPFDVFSDVSPQQVLSDFDESQTNEVLQRLGHTEIL
jgi:anti-sigma-K factor RskA